MTNEHHPSDETTPAPPAPPPTLPPSFPPPESGRDADGAGWAPGEALDPAAPSTAPVPPVPPTVPAHPAPGDPGPTSTLPAPPGYSAAPHAASSPGDDPRAGYLPGSGYAPQPGHLPPATADPYAPPVGYASGGAPSSVTSPRRPVGIGETALVWWNVIRASAKSDPNAAVDHALTARERTGNPHWLWLLTALVNGVIVGGIWMVSMSQGASFLYDPSAGDYVAAFFLAVVISVVALIARAGVVLLTASARRGSVSFTDALTLTGAAWGLTTPLLVLTFALIWVDSLGAAMVLFVAAVLTVMVAELTLYTGILQRGRFPASPLLLHAVLTAIWLLLVLLVFGAFADQLAPTFPGLADF